MDPTRFDALARTLAAAATRRRVISLLLGAGFAAEAGDASAKNAGQQKAKKGNARPQRSRKNKERRIQAPRAEAVRCCSTGGCTPGKGKNLSKCCYQGQDLSGKNFQGANLGSANFSGATLTNANLSGANAGKACFVDADLRGLRTNASTNLDGAIYCRTRTDSGENNAGCDKGSPCCPACDEASPCDDGFVCCNGRCAPGDCCGNGDCGSERCCANVCAAGDCCAAVDCPNEVCRRRACDDNQCVYTPVTGEPGPGCQTVCCQNEQGAPACCATGVTTCLPNERCGCANCAPGNDCVDGVCIAGGGSGDPAATVQVTFEAGNNIMGSRARRQAPSRERRHGSDPV